MLIQRMWFKKRKYILCIGVVAIIYLFFGIGDHFKELNYDKDFNYPLNIDIKPLVEQMLNGKEPDIEPINIYQFDYKNFTKTCQENDLVILVKSARRNFKRRIAIRHTWGSEIRFPNKNISLAFFLGSANDGLDMKISKEARHYRDIIQSDYYDSYYNNTIKTMVSFRWAYLYCKSKYYLFSDDDMYISIVNLFDYIDSIDGDEFYSGYVFNTAPHRHYASKWHVSLQEYPYDKWPPYVTAGAYVMSSKTLTRLYLASLYTKHFRFDDIYLGLVAKKAGIALRHCNQFYFYKKKYTEKDYETVIASHGYGNQYQMMKVWNRENELGYA